jgi:hypothetical protein
MEEEQPSAALLRARSDAPCLVYGYVAARAFSPAWKTRQQYAQTGVTVPFRLRG